MMLRDYFLSLIVLVEYTVCIWQTTTKKLLGVALVYPPHMVEVEKQILPDTFYHSTN